MFARFRVLWQRAPRFVKFAVSGTVIGAVGLGVLYFEIKHLGWDSQLAKLSLSLLLPLSLGIHWLIWSDRNARQINKMGPRWAITLISSRWAVVRLVFFASNQLAYAALLHKAGLGGLEAQVVASPVMSTLSYVVNTAVVFVGDKTVRQSTADTYASIQLLFTQARSWAFGIAKA